jgi:hypothetical protein
LADGEVGAVNLPYENAGQQKTCGDGENHGPPECLLESLEFQTFRLSSGSI